MRTRSILPSPPAGEGAERRRREAGEGAARVLRARLTDAERKLWFALRDRRFNGLKFRRQVPVGPFIADFLCFDYRLVIEVDGGQHAGSTADKRRNLWFAENDFRVLRFWNNDVLPNLEGVLTRVGEAVAVTPHPPSLRSGTLSRKGRGKEEIAAPSVRSTRGEGKKGSGSPDEEIAR